MKKYSLLLALFFALSGTLQATIHVINVSNFVFTPSVLTVNCFDTIQFHRVDGTHPVVSETGAWTTFVMSGALINQNVVLATAGTYDYYCDLHGAPGGLGMAGTITVLCAPPTCTTPTGVGHSMVTSTTAKISWSAVVGATKYQIQYRPMGTITWLKKNSTTLSKKLIGLTPGTTYQYRVKAICDVGGSPFSAIQTFTTLAMDGGEVETKQESFYEDHTTKMGVYPNPNPGEFQLVLMHVHQDDVLVKVYDITGKLIHEQVATVSEMDVVEHIKLPETFKGTAIIKVNIAGKDYTKEIVVQ